MRTKQVTIYIADDGNEFASEEACLAHEARSNVDDVIYADDSYYESTLHISDADELEAFLIHHEALILKMMGWNK